MHTLQHEREGVCILPGRPGNMGDVRVLSTCVQILKKEKLLLLSYERGLWDALFPDTEIVLLSDRTTCATSPVSGWFGKIRRMIASLSRMLRKMPVIITTLRRSKCFILLGMDNLDGHYGVFYVLQVVSLVWLARWSGARVEIINCSFNSRPSRLAVVALRCLPSAVRIVAREPIAQARMERYLSRPIVLAADVAFLFRPVVRAQNALQPFIDWIRGERVKGQRVLGLNMADIPDVPTDDLVRMCIRTVERMRSASFLLIPHVKYGLATMPDEEQLLRRILSGLSLESRGRCSLVPFPYDLSDLEQLLSALDCALTGRMHFSIGLLSVGVPVCCVPYQDKFEGLFVDYLHMPELLFNLNAVIAEGDFVQPLQEFLSSRDAYARRIQEELPLLRKLSAKNFWESDGVLTGASAEIPALSASSRGVFPHHRACCPAPLPRGRNPSSCSRTN